MHRAEVKGGDGGCEVDGRAMHKLHREKTKITLTLLLLYQVIINIPFTNVVSHDLFYFFISVYRGLASMLTALGEKPGSLVLL